MKRAVVLVVALLASALAGAVTLDVATANFTHPGCLQPPHYSHISVESPVNVTYRTTRISLAFTHTTNSGGGYYFYILDGEGSMRVGDVKVDVEPVKATSRIVDDPAIYKDPFTEYTFECNVTLPRLAGGSHNIIIGCYFKDVTISEYLALYSDFVLDTVFFGVKTSPPQVSIFLLENVTGDAASFPLSFRIVEEASWIRWIGYSLDGEGNVSISKDSLVPRVLNGEFLYYEGALTLSGLSTGAHSVAVYAENMDGRMGVALSGFEVGQGGGLISGFSSTTLVAVALIVTVAIISFGLVAYLLKRKRRSQP